MRKLAFFTLFVTMYSNCFAAPSITRASSVPLGSAAGTSAPKVTVSATTTAANKSAPSAVTTGGNVDLTNNSRIAFASPINKTNRYYIPTNNNSGNTGSGTTDTANTAKEMAELQKQIDDLVTEQTRMRDSLPSTVQTEIKNSDLTKNTSFNDAISDLQESAISESDINTKITNKLQEKGIVDNSGNLLVATTEEIQPIALSQKLENTLAVKFAKKDDFTPSKIASGIVTDDTAIQTLSGKIGASEDSVNSLIASDLKKRGIINNDNSLRVATKSELPVIDAETVSAALQNTNTFDNMISQNLVSKGIYDSNQQLQVIKKSEITPEFLSAKLDSTYAKPDAVQALDQKITTIRDGDENQVGSIAYKISNAGFARASDVTSDALTQKLDNIYVRPSAITPTELSNKLNNVFVTPGELASKNFATKSELPQINEQTVSAALRNSTTINDTVTANLKAKNILDANENLNVATKSEVHALDDKFALKGETETDETAVKDLISSDLKSRGIIDSQTGRLKVATVDNVSTLSNKVDSLETAISNTVTPDNIAENLPSIVITDRNLDAKIIEKNLATKSDLPVVDETTINDALSKSTTLTGIIDNAIDSKGYLTNDAIDSLARKTDLDGYAKTTDIFENGKLISSKLPTGVITTGNIANNLPSDVLKTGALNGYAKTTDLSGFLTDSDLTQAKLVGKLGSAYLTTATLPTDIVRTTGGKIDTNILPTDVLKTGALTGYAKTSDIFDSNNRLIAAKLPTAVITSDNFDAIMTTKNLATKSDLPVVDETTINDALSKSTTLTGIIDNALNNKGYLTSSDISTLARKTDLDGYAKTTDIFENGKLISSKLPTGVITTENIASNLPSDVLKTGALNGYAKTTDLSGFLTDSDLTQAKLVGKLGSAYLTTSTLPADIVRTTDGKITADILPTTIARKTDLSGFLTDSDLTQAKLVGKLGSAYLTTSTLPADIVRTTGGKIDTNILPTDVLKTGALTGYAKTSDIFDSNNRLIAAKLPTAVITSDNFDAIMTTKNLATKSDLPVVDETTINNALSESTTLTGIIDNALENKGYLTSSDISTLARKTDLDGYAKTTDLSGFLTDSDLTQAKLTQKLGNAYLTTSTLPADIVRTTDGKITADILPTTIALKTDLDGYAKTTDLTANKLSETLGSTYAKPSDLTSYAKTSDILDDNGVLKTPTIPTNLVTSDNLTTMLNEYATTATISDLTTRTMSLETNALTADNLATKLSAENSGVMTALSNAGFAKTSDITTTINNTLNGTGEGSFASRLTNAGVITTGNIANSLPANVVTTTTNGKIAASALPDTVVTTSNIATDNNIKTALTNAGFAQSSDVTELATRTSSLETNAITTNNLNNATIRSALSDAGFAKTSDINTQVNSQSLTMADLGNILTQGILMVKSDGTLGIDPTKTTTGVGTKLSQVGNISSMTASTNIATSVAAATSAAVAVDDITDSTTCNSTDYMYWDTTRTKCLKCPDTTKFIGGSTRCQCIDPMTEFSVSGGVCNQLDVTQARCNQTENMYWNSYTSKCLACPGDSYYKESSCLCTADNMMLNIYAGKCMVCPPESEYNPETRKCGCANQNSINHELWYRDPAQACSSK